MKNRITLLLTVASVVLVGLVVLGILFYYTDDATDGSLQLQVSCQIEPNPPEIPSSEPTSDSRPAEASSASHLGSSMSAQTRTQSNTFSLDPRNGESISATNSGHIADESDPAAMIDETDAYWPHMPLAFMNDRGILPTTEEVAAALQNLQRDFINATGAETANPADPNFEQLWEWAQPTADEQFYALFGIEAFNAMSIMEAHQRGHL